HPNKRPRTAYLAHRRPRPVRVSLGAMKLDAQAATLSRTQILDAAHRLNVGDAAQVSDKNAAVDVVANDLAATSPAGRQLIRETLTALWATTNEAKGALFHGRATKTVEAPIDNRTTTANLRAPGVPANVLNAVTPLLEKGAL